MVVGINNSPIRAKCIVIIHTLHGDTVTRPLLGNHDVLRPEKRFD